MASARVVARLLPSVFVCQNATFVFEILAAMTASAAEKLALDSVEVRRFACSASNLQHAAAWLAGVRFS